MKTFISLLIAILVLSLVFYFLPRKEEKHYSDDELRQTALSRNMKSIPKTYEALLLLVDSKDNPLTKDKIALGKELYFDTILSKNKDISCATCHMIFKNPKSKTVYSDMLTAKTPNSDCAICHLKDQSATDRLETAVGHLQQQNPLHLNTLSTLNVSLAKYLTWSGEVSSVEEQSGLSIKDPYKMHMSEDEVVQRLKRDKIYVEKFSLVFSKISFDNIKKALGAYLRTLTTRSAYDRFLDGDNNAMSKEAKKGLANFINFGCKGCHTGITVGGQSIQKFPVRDYNSILDITSSFHEGKEGRVLGTIGINFNIHHAYPFKNDGGYMGKNGEQLFRVPILRNVTKTSPYFHNGTIKKIREAVYIMAKHQLGMNLTQIQIDEIVAFLEALEGDIVEYKIPNAG